MLPPGRPPAEVADEFDPEQVLIVAARSPAFIDQVLVFATQEEIGLPVTPRQIVFDAVREIPFWPAMKLLARFQRDLWPVRTDAAGQIELLHRFYGVDSGYTRHATAFLKAGERRVLFSEQQLFTVQKLLLLYGADSDVDQELTELQEIGLKIAIAAVPGSVLGPQAEELAEKGGGITDETWLRLFAGHGGFIGRGSLRHELARTHRLYVEGVNSDSARARADYCPLDDWVREAFQLSFLELQAAGFALWGGSRMGDPRATPVLVDPSYFKPTALADRAQLALDALSENREWYREVFLASADDERRLAFDITPFLQRPALRFPDGRVMPFAPRALEGWFGATGAYYRLFDLARGKDTATLEHFRTFNGFLVEQHVLATTRAAHPPNSSGAIWVPTVLGEQVEQVAAGESRTPDVAVDYGPDLVLIEVTSGRPTTASIVDADPEAIRRDIEKLLEVKIRQLGARIADLRHGTLTLPDVNIDAVERIWPVVVNSEGLFQTPVLWAHLREGARALEALDQPGVQPLTLLDVEDLERLMGLSQAGRGLIATLESKTQVAWRDREFASWAEAEARDLDAAFPFIDEALEASFHEMIQTLLGDQTLDEYQARVAEAREALGRQEQADKAE